MKVLFIGMRWDYGDKSRGSSFEYDTFFRTLTHLKGVKPYCFDFFSHFKKLGKEEMNQRLLRRIGQLKPRLVFFVLFRDEFYRETIKKISQDPQAVTFNWFCDDDWRWEEYSQHWAPCFNYVGTTAKAASLKYRSIGYKGAIFTPWAVNHFVYQNLKLPKAYDVSFVGLAHSNRKGIIKRLEKKGIKVNCWGRGWPDGRVSTQRMIRIFNQTKINLNFAAVSIRFRLGEKLPWWLQPKTVCHPNDEVKGRNFEVPGCGSFFLTGHTQELNQFYHYDREIVVFKNFDELVEKIRYYLDHEREREKIARAGYRRTLKDHTYEKRFKEIFKKIGLI